MDISLTPEEVEIEVFVLDWYRRKLLHEIAGTDAEELRKDLGHKDTVVETILSKLQDPAAA